MKNLLITLFISGTLVSCTQKEAGQEARTEHFVDSVLNRMSLTEKIGQMNQLNFEGPIDSFLQKIESGEIGSVLNVVDPKIINQMQKAAFEGSQSGVPLIIGRDVIHGYKTIFPIPLGQAASFDPQIVEDGARIAATEARENGIHWTFAPMLDISRDARWGRIAESLGEDPVLTGTLGAAMIRGFQGTDMSAPSSIAACVKHFVGYGASEGGRDYNSTNIPMNLMRNIYLPPFQKVIEAGAASLMTAFNDNDGIPCSANNFLLKDILRQEWKFNGFVVSDWTSMSEMISHGYAADSTDVALLAANAGVDMEMVSETYHKKLEQLVKEGKVSEEDIDHSVRNILRIKYKLGLFDNPYIKTGKETTAYSPEHLAKAREAAVKSAILLKNNSVLPLKRSIKIAVIGPMADAGHDQLGTWSFDGEGSHTVTPLKALKEELTDINYIYEPGLKYSRDKNTTGFSKALEAARKSDAAVVFLGEEAILSGEAHSLSNINLIGAQSELLKSIKNVGKPVILVIMAGRPLTIERDLPYADAVLYNFHPGTMGGAAIWDLLYGKENPSGKLPVTFVREVGQIPMYYNHNNTGRPAPESVIGLDDIPQEAGQTSLGNTSFYLDSGNKPLFPFGYGLSYSKFVYSDLHLSTSEITKGEKLTAEVTIKNKSDRDGTEVVQLYVQDLVGSIARPIKELKSFRRVPIKAGESQKVTFTLTADDLAFYGRDLKKIAESGDFNLWIGSSSADGLKTHFKLK